MRNIEIPFNQNFRSGCSQMSNSYKKRNVRMYVYIRTFLFILRDELMEIFLGIQSRVDKLLWDDPHTERTMAAFQRIEDSFSVFYVKYQVVCEKLTPW